ncbi:NHL repeat-containing protein [candidate division KSB1 bacterium]
MNAPYSYVLLLLLIFPKPEAAAFQVPDYIPVRFFGEKGTEPGMMSAPEGISVDNEGNIYVADTGNNRIQKFLPDGRVLRLYGGFGWSEEQFDTPVSIHAETGLDVYVADKNNHRVVRFDRSLNYISTMYVNNFNDETFRFQFPAALTVTELKDMFVIDSENARIVRISAFGTPEAQFGGYMSAGIPLSRPEYITEYANNKIYVTDTGQNNIAIYDYFGNYIGHLSNENMQSPGGLCVDRKGFLYVCDPEAHNIKIFDEKNRLISEINNSFFNAPVDIACLENMLYIVDRDTSRIFVYEIIYN